MRAANRSATNEEGRSRIEVPPDFRGMVGAMLTKNIMARARAEGVTAGQEDLELRFNQ